MEKPLIVPDPLAPLDLHPLASGCFSDFGEAPEGIPKKAEARRASPNVVVGLQWVGSPSECMPSLDIIANMVK